MAAAIGADRRARPARRRHLARDRSRAALRRGYQLPRAAAPRARGALARSADPELPRRGRGQQSAARRRVPGDSRAARRPLLGVQPAAHGSRLAVVRLEPQHSLRAPPGVRRLRIVERAPGYAMAETAAGAPRLRVLAARE